MAAPASRKVGSAPLGILAEAPANVYTVHAPKVKVWNGLEATFCWKLNLSKAPEPASVVVVWVPPVEVVSV